MANGATGCESQPGKKHDPEGLSARAGLCDPLLMKDEEKMVFPDLFKTAKGTKVNGQVIYTFSKAVKVGLERVK